MEDDDLKVTVDTKIDGDNFKVDGTVTLKRDDVTLNDAVEEAFLMFMYMASNSAEMDGKTFVEINEWSESDDAELGSDDWAIAVMAMQSALGVEVKGFGAQGDEEWEDEEAGWTGSQSLGDKEWTISASRT